MSDKQEQQQQNDVLQFLVDMRSGAVAADITAKFTEMIQAVINTGQKGELTITLMAEPSKFGMGGAVLEVSAEHKVKMKKPELAIGKSLFFVTKEGRLTRDDPAQEAMFQMEPQNQKERTQ